MTLGGNGSQNSSGWEVHKLKNRVVGHRMPYAFMPIGIDLHCSKCLGPVLKKSQRIRFAPNGRQRNSTCLPTSRLPCTYDIDIHAGNIDIAYITMYKSFSSERSEPAPSVASQPWEKDSRIAILTTNDSYLCPTTPEGKLSNMECNSNYHLCADNPRKSRGHA